MGIYWVRCCNCGYAFLWFSMALDQRCTKCKLYANHPGPQRLAPTQGQK